MEHTQEAVCYSASPYKGFLNNGVLSIDSNKSLRMLKELICYVWHYYVILYFQQFIHSWLPDTADQLP